MTIRKILRVGSLYVILTALSACTGMQGGNSSAAINEVAQAEANKRVVLDFWRVVIEARDIDAITQYCTPDMIQHNPTMSDGIAGFAERTKIWWKDGGVKRPVEPALRNPPALVVAQNDLVMLMFKRQTPDPARAGQTYDLFTFDLYRVKNNKIVEHWDSVMKPPLVR